ncbi:hypothetical protein Dimus_037994 [Dionaea muscipula]
MALSHSKSLPKVRARLSLPHICFPRYGHGSLCLTSAFSSHPSHADNLSHCSPFLFLDDKEGRRTVACFCCTLPLLSLLPLLASLVSTLSAISGKWQQIYCHFAVEGVVTYAVKGVVTLTQEDDGTFFTFFFTMDVI